MAGFFLPLACPQVGCLLNYSVEASVDGMSKTHGINDAIVREGVNAIRAAARFDQPGALEAAEKQQYTIKPTLLAIKLTGMIAEPALFARATNALASSSEYQRGTLSNQQLFPDSPELSDEDKKDLDRLYQGLREIAHEAREGGVRLLVDAEQSWYQPA
jgi:proline dehydrogenase